MIDWIGARVSIKTEAHPANTVQYTHHPFVDKRTDQWQPHARPRPVSDEWLMEDIADKFFDDAPRKATKKSSRFRKPRGGDDDNDDGGDDVNDDNNDGREDDQPENASRTKRNKKKQDDDGDEFDNYMNRMGISKKILKKDKDKKHDREDKQDKQDKDKDKDKDEGECTVDKDMPVADAATLTRVERSYYDKHWAALQLLVLQVYDWDRSKLQSCLTADTQHTLDTKWTHIKTLQSYIVKVLTKELSLCLSVSRTLAKRADIRWGIRHRVLENIDKLLTLLLIMGNSLSHCPSVPFAATLLSIVHYQPYVTPHIMQLCLRLSRRILPMVNPDALAQLFQAILKNDGALSPTEHTLWTGQDLSVYLLHTIGSLIAKEQCTTNPAVPSITSTSNGAPSSDAKEKEVKIAEPLSSSDSGSDPTGSHAVQVHYMDGFSSDKWNQILVKPDFYDLVHGVRGLVPPNKEQTQKRALEEFDRRQHHRTGPAKVNMTGKAGSLDIGSDMRIASRAGFSTAVGNVYVTKGRWYYQVVLNSRGLFQIGWATNKHTPNTTTGDGCGDDVYSWAYDGHRCKKWHSGAQTYSQSRWTTNDVVTCALDLDVTGGEMRFFLNGDDLGVAFKNFAIGEGLYPCVSISSGESCTFVFEASKLKKTIGNTNGNGRNALKSPDGYYPLEGDKPVADDPSYMRRAIDISGQLEYSGHALLVQGDYQYCNHIAKKLALLGVTVTIPTVASAQSLRIDDPLKPNIPKGNHLM
jgi:hypothetical protein